MALTPQEIYQRQELKKSLLEQGYDTVVNHGYNHVKNVKLADYEKLICESTEWVHQIKIRVKDYIPMYEEFVMVFILSTKQFNEPIFGLIGNFFKKQTSMDGSDWGLITGIKQCNREYKLFTESTKAVEIFVKVSSISRSKGKSTVKGAIVDKDSWLELESISEFTDEKQVVVMTFENYMEFLSVNDINKYEQIIADRERREKERLAAN